MALYPLQSLSLCAGSGMLDVAARLATGCNTVCYVEWEAYAAASLVARMEDAALCDAPVWSDIATFDAKAFAGCVDVVLSGDPCVANSVAGKGLGSADDRFLIDRVIDITIECGAHTLIRENVPGNLAGQLAALHRLEQNGFRPAGLLFEAKMAGASHRRERFFYMAHSDDRYQRAYKGLCAGRHAPHTGGERLAYANSPRRETPGGGHIEHTGWQPQPGSGELGDTDREQRQGVRPDADAVRRQNENRSAALSGGTDIPLHAPGPNDPRWPAIIAEHPALEPSICRMADGLAYRVDRLRSCGNGVEPASAAVAITILAHTLGIEDRVGCAIPGDRPMTTQAAE